MFNIVIDCLNSLIKSKRKKFYKKYLHELADKYGLTFETFTALSISSIYIGDYCLMSYNSNITLYSVHWDGGVYDEIWNSNTNTFEKVEPDMRSREIEMGKTTNKKKIEKELIETIKIYKENIIKLKEFKMVQDFE